MSEKIDNMTIEEASEHFTNTKWPVWLYAAFFFIPCIVTFFLMNYVLETDMLFSGIVALAVMNGSINSVIAHITIKLDDKSSESLEHLDFINKEMGKLESTLEEANEKVSGFTTDLEEAKDIFRTVGVDLTELDLDSVAEVVEKLKENREGLGQVLDNLKSVDVEEYINHAKRINWRQLLGAAEEIMGFIQTRQNNNSKPTLELDTSQIQFGSVPEKEEDLEWVKYASSDNTGDFQLIEESVEVSREVKMPKPTPRLTRDKSLNREPKPRLSLSRR
jgi:hypothetical protein